MTAAFFSAFLTHICNGTVYLPSRKKRTVMIYCFGREENIVNAYIYIKNGPQLIVTNLKSIKSKQGNTSISETTDFSDIKIIFLQEIIQSPSTAIILRL